MQNHEPFKLYRHDGAEVPVRNVYRSTDSKLADHLISDDGRVIYCQDEQEGVFWFEDTRDLLYLNKPS